jgi:hypothetical protein
MGALLLQPDGVLKIYGREIPVNSSGSQDHFVESEILLNHESRRRVLESAIRRKLYPLCGNDKIANPGMASLGKRERQTRPATSKR